MNPQPSPQARHVATAFGITVVEALLPLRRRREAERRMARLVADEPDWTCTFFGGWLSSLARTLPESDPWRSLSARVGTHAVGPRPPPSVGAVRADGQRFGTWHDLEDRAPLVFASPVADVSLAAVADPLSDHAAALVGFAAHPWRIAVEATVEVRTHLAPTEAFEAFASAIRWLVARRRSWDVPGPDAWAFESCVAWAVRADGELVRRRAAAQGARLLASDALRLATLDAQVEAEIAGERLDR